MTGGRVVAVVLAAGGSTRLGRPKQTEQVGGVPLVTHALRAGSAADATVLVTGFAADAVAEIAPAGVEILHLATWQRGLGHVLASAVTTLRADTAAVVVLLGDQPGVTAAAVERLVAAWRAGSGPIVTAAYAGVPGHPRLFDASVFAALRDLDGDEGARSLLARYPVTPVEVDGHVLDVDDEPSLAAARSLTARRS